MADGWFSRWAHAGPRPAPGRWRLCVEVTGGLVTLWRDYFDSADLTDLAELISILGQ